jgi:hypothetical protein
MRSGDPLEAQQAELAALNQKIAELTQMLAQLTQGEQALNTVVIALDKAQDECELRTGSAGSSRSWPTCSSHCLPRQS